MKERHVCDNQPKDFSTRQVDPLKISVIRKYFWTFLDFRFTVLQFLPPESVNKQTSLDGLRLLICWRHCDCLK